ncbi:hypothetical protein NDU88_002235 [Pleurodeles waltl]|uniref:Reverse transcriptase Ty1/copia-type domain-containing protein n=1 Tax=Pleurodeles waltl TaxID=8319 RepID=A0AAV7V9Z6_PLEWA|nr:hypothetical protein NDU88_002235 [Pleurodeles waltl]
MDRWEVAVDGYTHIISLYVDDALVYVARPEFSVTELLETLTAFRVVSGLQANHQNLLLFPLANLVGMGAGTHPATELCWECDHFRYLGIQVAHNDEAYYSLNMGRVLDRLETLICF